MTVWLDVKRDVKLLDAWKDKEGHYAKIFLADDERNANEWRVTWPSIQKNHESFKGFPGIEYHVCDAEGCSLDHIDRSVYKSVLLAQESYRVSNIVDTALDESTRTAYGVHEIAHEFFERAIDNDTPIYVSPAMWPKKRRCRDRGIYARGGSQD